MQSIREESAQIKELGKHHPGTEKCVWAKKIAPHMDVEKNESKSFQVFRDGIKKLAGIAT